MSSGIAENRTTYLLAANILVLAVVAYAWFLETRLPDFYYMSVQEDEYIEWASFWAFILAAVAAVVASRTHAGRIPWFLYGLALFCFIVAMEEISWGQRLPSTTLRISATSGNGTSRSQLIPK